MKHLKTILLAATMLLSFTISFGQEKKPSHEETAQWIADKLKQNLRPGYWFESYDPNTGVFKYKSNDYVYTIYLGNVTKFENCKVTGTKVFFVKSTESSYTEFLDDFFVCYLVYVDIDITKVEGLKERMDKAMKTLIEYNLKVMNGDKEEAF